ncbi:COX15/CtaA family protein [Marmoricola endophyticus]|uniref:COX15/CtaA family protein n=1 Tax=Marmoricola endophyticus TaxID=2040280 RepID=UPI001E284860|nr:COX15/CtaA family protein [Marmoricola endophyticus]
MHTDTADRSAQRWVVRAGWLSLVANVVIVCTGGAVRLTGSGLGCDTWPRCNGSSFTPHGAYDIHSLIEFGNRTLNGVLVTVAILTIVAVFRSARRDLRGLSVLMALAIPAQAVLGGITVLTDLNPWIVSLHLLLSMAIIGVCVLFLWRASWSAGQAATRPRGTLRGLAVGTFAAGWVVLYLGTVVTGSGPHAGDVDSPRNGLDPERLSQLHADAVFLLVGLTVGLVVALRVTGSYGAYRAARVLLAVELAQGVVGVTQYATGLPVLLVGLHLLGAALTSAALTWMLLETARPRRTTTSPPASVPG